MTLKELKAGKSAVILSVGGEGALRQHFLDMGLIQGTEVTVVKYAPMGDPVELRLHGYELTIRLADAEKIEVTEIAQEAQQKQKEKLLLDEELLTFALVGNQNSGKTTLFNALTGANQHVGNFPGVTVDRKDGVIKGYANTRITDLPGIYSLSPYSSEEIVTREFLLNDRPKGMINIVDATNIERNLYLTMQLLELNMPMVVALNMMDELRGNGGSVLVDKLEAFLGVPVVPISAAKGEGIEELVKHALYVAKYQEYPAKTVTEQINMQMEEESGMDRASVMAKKRFDYIRKVCETAVIKPQESKEHLRSRKIDSLLTGKYTGIPMFIGIMGTVFWLTFNVIGASLQGVLESGVEWVTELASSAMAAMQVNEVIHGLVIDGIFNGIGSVLGFLPIIVTLFFFLSMLEDSGYMARVAFIMDKLLRKIGLSGRSIVPLLIGFGCSVPGVMACRTLSSERDRKMTILLTPFMSCTAKLPIYAFFTAAFFEKYQAFVMLGLYLGGIVMGILTATVMNKTMFRGEPVPFVMELPNYRMPGVRNVALLLWEKAKDFLLRAFTVIFVATIAIWFLQNFDLHLNIVSDSQDSILAAVSGVIAPVFKPLGFGEWEVATALITGFMAKESVVSTLSVLFGTTEVLTAMLAPAGAAALLVFSLLYTPCVAAVASIKRELGGKWALYVVIGQCAIAWAAAFVVYRFTLLVF